MSDSSRRPVHADYPSTDMKRTVMALLCAAATATAADNMKAFPPADDGMVRHVLQLPPQADEDALKVELVLGKTVKTDSVNRYFFGGKIEVETIQGWGFDRYVLKQLGPMAGTLMAPPPDAGKKGGWNRNSTRLTTAKIPAGNIPRDCGRLRHDIIRLAYRVVMWWNPRDET